jgi:AraC-like DNA-binding protein
LRKLHVAPGQEWPLAFPRWCAFRICEGEGFWLAKNHQRALARGDIGVICPFAQGLLRASQLSELKATYFLFSPGLLMAFLSMSEDYFFRRLESNAANPYFFAGPEHPASEHFARALAAPAGNNLIVRGEMIAVLGRVFSTELAMAARAADKDTGCSGRFRDFLNELSAEEFMRLSSEQIASRCGCSHPQFYQLFRRNFGRSLKTAKKELKLFRARDLLTESGFDIQMIAQEAGYQRTATFVAMFKKQFSVSPARWREAVAELDLTAEFKPHALLDPHVGRYLSEQ